MKLPNFLIHTFAAVGVISLIFWSCAAADSDSIDNPPQLTGGTYQVETLNQGSDQIVVLNTETGVMKTYYPNINTGVWTEYENYYFEVTFTH